MSTSSPGDAPRGEGADVPSEPALSGARVAALRSELEAAGFRPSKRLGQNLLQDRHSEFASALATPIRRTVNGKATWRF